MDRRAWRTTVHRVTKSWTWPKRLSTNTCVTCVCVRVCVCVCVCVCACVLNGLRLVWVPCPPREDLPYLGIKPVSLISPALAGMFFTSTATLYNFMCTTYWFEIPLYCNMIAIAVIIRTNITSHNYNFFLVFGKTNSLLASLMIIIQYHLSLIYCALALKGLFTTCLLIASLYP